MTAFRKAALIFNPMSGQKHAMRAAKIEAALAVLRAAGVEAEAVPTRGPGTAGAQALEAAGRGCDAVLACGGDGTVHEVLQGLAGTATALGVIPLGTANALAVDLGLPREAVDAARRLLTAEPVRIAAGRLSYTRNDGSSEQRYFTVALGIGADAHLMYHLDASLKRRFGYVAYMAQALRIWATHDFPWFEICADGQVHRVSQLLAVRIANFGGLLRQLAPGASLRSNSLRLVAFKTRSRWRYLRFMTAILLGRRPRVREVELLDASRVECRTVSGSQGRVYVEADGEALGILPARVEIVPEAVTLLMPTGNGSC